MTPLRQPAPATRRVLIGDPASATGLSVVELPVLGVNRVREPNFEDGLTGWSARGPSPTISRDTAVFETGSASMKVTMGATNQVDWGAAVEPPVTAGQPVTFYARINAPVGIDYGLTVLWRDPSGIGIGQIADLIRRNGTGEWSDLLVTSTPPAGAVKVTAVVHLYSTNAAIHVDRAAIGSGGYFDGDTPGCRWTGPPHASTSEKLLPSAADLA